MDQQRSQSEETVTKLKQLLMRNKKELGESKKREGELQQAVDDLHSKMEAEKQTAELAKVCESESERERERETPPNHLINL